ncbi:MAG: hypothetical protein BJ554DRAFT_5239 [Olpidium bornovanus]|uniref:RRM domain-containing protein n=1 Tax=Olpidium bornovanus TaxID=278681 RepID=A0A8H8DE79_9FUNG|nr:MAG: hypothetical protein BJ554DRAFT_5239 [Olpidium bornovanus]
MAPGMGISADAYGVYTQKSTFMSVANGGGIPGAGIGIGSVGIGAGVHQQHYPVAAYQAALGGSYFGGGATGTSGGVGMTGQQGGTEGGGAYSPNQHAAFAVAIAAQQAAASAASPTRTVYIGGIPPDVAITRLLDHVKCAGPIENVRHFPDKSCAFIYFLDVPTAALFHQECQHKKLTVDGHELRVGWGKPSSLPPAVLAAAEAGATRNVYLGHLDEDFNEDRIREDLGRFGTVEHVKVIRDKSIGFAHLLSIQAAVKCVTALQNDPDYQGRRVHYGKDRCAVYQNKPGGLPCRSFQQCGFQNPVAFTGTFGGQDSFHVPDVGVHGFLLPHDIPGTNRSVYLGGIHPDATGEDICNAIRGGILSQIRYIPDKHIAFVTFVEPSAAMQFYNNCAFNGLAVKSRRVRVGWGKSVVVPREVLMAVQAGASRNVYLGGIDESTNEDKLRADFAPYGEIELVNILREKNCGFINFTSIVAALKAVEGMRMNSEYAGYKVNFGKDRCGNPPRTPRVIDRTSAEGGAGAPPPGCVAPGGPGFAGPAVAPGVPFGAFSGAPPNAPSGPLGAGGAPVPGAAGPLNGPAATGTGPPGVPGGGQLATSAAGLRVTSPVSFFP